MSVQSVAVVRSNLSVLTLISCIVLQLWCFIIQQGVALLFHKFLPVSNNLSVSFPFVQQGSPFLQMKKSLSLQTPRSEQKKDRSADYRPIADQ